MRKILLGFLVIAAVLVFVAGGTLAYFSDTETSTGNTFTAGTLDLQVVSPYKGEPYEGFPPEKTYNGQNIPGIELEDMKPGDPSIVWRMHVNNIGSINGVLFIHFDVTKNDENVLWEPEAAMGDTEDPNVGVPGTPHNGELGGYLLVDVYYGDEAYWSQWQSGDYGHFVHAVTAAPVNDIHCDEIELGVLNAELDPATQDGKDVILVFTLPGPTPPTDAMSAIVVCDIDLILIQQ